MYNIRERIAEAVALIRNLRPVETYIHGFSVDTKGTVTPENFFSFATNYDENGQRTSFRISYSILDLRILLNDFEATAFAKGFYDNELAPYRMAIRNQYRGFIRDSLKKITSGAWEYVELPVISIEMEYIPLSDEIKFKNVSRKVLRLDGCVDFETLTKQFKSEEVAKKYFEIVGRDPASPIDAEQTFTELAEVFKRLMAEFLVRHDIAIIEESNDGKARVVRGPESNPDARIIKFASPFGSMQKFVNLMQLGVLGFKDKPLFGENQLKRMVEKSNALKMAGYERAHEKPNYISQLVRGAIIDGNSRDKAVLLAILDLNPNIITLVKRNFERMGYAIESANDSIASGHYYQLTITQPDRSVHRSQIYKYPRERRMNHVYDEIAREIFIELIKKNGKLPDNRDAFPCNLRETVHFPDKLEAARNAGRISELSFHYTAASYACAER